MNTIKCNRLVIGLMVSMLGFTAQAMYNPDQAVMFEKSNQCYNCDLSGAVLAGNHSGAQLMYSNLTGAHFFENFSAANFNGSNLSYATFGAMFLPMPVPGPVTMEGINLSYADLSNIELIATDFTSANLSHANFMGSITNNARFVNANLFASNITQAQLDAASSYCFATLPDGHVKNC